MAVCREFTCEDCGESFELYCSIKDPIMKECSCGGELRQVFSAAPTVMVEQEPKTMGGLALQNTKRNGKEWAAEQRQKDLDRQRESRIARRAAIESRLPAGARLDPIYEGEKKKVDLSLTKMTPDQTKRYIETGKKPLGL